MAEEKYPEPIVGAIIVNREGKILLSRGKKWGGKYVVFGGHVEVGESLVEAIKREIKEEAGLNVRAIDQLGFSESVESSHYYKKKHFIFLNFLCLFEGAESEVKTNSEFEKEYKWLSVEEALKLDLLDQTKDLIEKFIEYKESRNI